MTERKTDKDYLHSQNFHCFPFPGRMIPSLPITDSASVLHSSQIRNANELSNGLHHLAMSQWV